MTLGLVLGEASFERRMYLLANAFRYRLAVDVPFLFLSQACAASAIAEHTLNPFEFSVNGSLLKFR